MPESTVPPRREVPPGTLRIGTIAGADVVVSRSWFLIAGLIAVLIAPAVDRVTPGLGAAKYLAGAAFAVILYASVLAHEASHAVVARHFGYSVRTITLHFLGGFTQIEHESARAKHEFWIAVVGPLTSLAIGGAAIATLLLDPPGLIGLAVQGLAGANLVVGLLNLVPGLPLDGGRVLKAVVWGVTGSANRGLLLAGWAGRGAAVLVLAWPLVWQGLTGTQPVVSDYVFSAMVAFFVMAGASQAVATARLRGRFAELRARDLARRSIEVPDDLPLSEAVRRAQEAQAGGIVTVSADGRPHGIVHEAAVIATPVDRRPWVPVMSVARTLEAGLQLSADLAGEDLVAAIAEQPSPEFVLIEPDGSVFGILSVADVDAAIRSGNR